MLVVVALALFSLMGYLVFWMLELFLGFLATLASVFSVAMAVTLLLSGTARDPQRIPCYWTDRVGIYVALYTYLSCWLWMIVQVSGL
jgi:hypothetical protein